jgi:hypothetical protein
MARLLSIMSQTAAASTAQAKMAVHRRRDLRAFS